MNKYIYIGDNKIAPYRPDKYDNNLYCEDEIIEVVKEPTHSWEINQILVEEVDMEFEYAPVTKMNGSQSARLVAVPISKPNTDVKQNLVASNSANGIVCCDAPVSCTNTDEHLKISDMRKNQITPKEEWPLEQFKARIVTVEKEIKEASQEMNEINSRMNELAERKKHLQVRISKKRKYINLLTENLFDNIPDIEDKQVREDRLEREKLNNVPKPDECDATDDDQRTKR